MIHDISRTTSLRSYYVTVLGLAFHTLIAEGCLIHGRVLPWALRGSLQAPRMSPPSGPGRVMNQTSSRSRAGRPTTYGIQSLMVRGRNMSMRIQRILWSPTLDICSNLCHATELSLARSECHCVERNGFPTVVMSIRHSPS